MFLMVIITHTSNQSTAQKKDVQRFRSWLQRASFSKMVANVYYRPLPAGQDSVQKWIDIIERQQPWSGVIVECIAVTNRQFQDRLTLYGRQMEKIVKGDSQR